MKSLEQIKTEYFQKRSQFVLLNPQGYWVDSCHTLISLKNRSTSLFTTIPFLESMQDVLQNLPKEEKLRFPCIRAHLTGDEGYYDFVFEKYDAHILWIIYDFTHHYAGLIPIQQEKNENAIEGELLRIQQKADALEKQLLRYKNEELERIQSAKTTFFSQVSHEIRTPLNSILGLSELISDEQTTDNKAYKEALHATAHHLASIVNDILDISKLEAGKLDFRSISFHLPDIIKNIVNSFYYASQQKQIKIYYSVAANIPATLSGDPVRLSQVLYNLLGNAIKFTHEGCINLSATLQKKSGDRLTILFKVTDTGIGISPENIEKIFAPYEQGQRDIYQLYGGTGLGLGIVKKIIELQNGNISISSQVQQGTTVSFDLTFTKGEQRKSHDKPEKPVKLNHIKTVLVGEDDPISQKVLKTLLQQWNIQCTVVSDGKQVLEKLSTHTFDLLLIDRQMPRKTGIEVVDILQKRKIDIPVILLTGATPAAPSSFKIEAWIEKPVVPSLLLKKIRILDKEIEEESINLNYLKNITDDNTALMIDLIDTFIGTMPEQIQQMKSFAAKKNWDALYRTAHRAKPGFQYMGVSKLHALARQLEENVQNGVHRETYMSNILQIEEFTQRVVQKLQSFKIELQRT